MKKFLLSLLLFPLFLSAQVLDVDTLSHTFNPTTVGVNESFTLTLSNALAVEQVVSFSGLDGYTCIDIMSVVDAFIPIADRVILIKDYNGEIYFPEFNFNGIGNLIYSRGYQSYLSEEVFDFSICPTLLAE